MKSVAPSTWQFLRDKRIRERTFFSVHSPRYATINVPEIITCVTGTNYRVSTWVRWRDLNLMLNAHAAFALVSGGMYIKNIGSF
jgi:hypothetical protein